jgi:hypothetical protein
MVVIVSSVFATGITVMADRDGFFVGDGAVAGQEVFPGPGVPLAVKDARGRVAGRLDPRAPEPSVWVRDAAGALTPAALRIAASDTSRRADVNAAALAALARAPASETLATFAEICGGPSREGPAPVPTDAAPPQTSRPVAPPPAAGEPLEAWAPLECVFVRFRSVEAAYRFASVADALAGALAASESEDARDYGTLRLVLHDLTLPTIWRTNPDAQRGVGEVALVVAPPFVRGRLRAAAILRITDPELHRMQTEAGIAQESHEDHLWRPAADPFPAERERLNFRAQPAGADVEVVATDRELGERIAARASATVASSPEFRELRAATAGDGAAAADEAVFAFSALAADARWRAIVPGVLRTAAREGREGLGLRHLGQTWLGAALEIATADVRSRGPSLLADAVALRVTTDAKGAAVTLRCVDAAAAGRFAQALRALPSGGAAAARACAANLRDLLPLALVEPPGGEVAERAFVVLGWKPVCPCGGAYSVHPVTREPSCSAHGTAAAPRAAKWSPPAVSEVRADGAELSFRLGIDWNRRE